MNKILVSGTYIIEPLRETLDFWVKKIPLSCDVKFAPYNQLFHTLSVNNQSNDAIIILIRTADLISSSHSKNEQHQNLCLFVQYLKNACSVNSANIFVIHCPDKSSDRWKRYLQQKVAHITGAYYIDLEEWLKIYSVIDIYDSVTEHSAHIPYKPLVYTVLGTVVARIIYTLNSPIIKLVAVDCDNTLWKGIVAEEGQKNIQITSGYRAFQSWILKLYDRGISIALCSKNHCEDVIEVFEKCPEMLLKKKHILEWCVNWEKKGVNITNLLKKLNIGIESVLVLDDNPIECAEIKFELPGALVVQTPLDENHLYSFYHHIWDIPIYQKETSEDRQRSTMYMQHLKREKLKSSSKSFSKFIDSLRLNIEVRIAGRDDIERVSQLTHRTNQFNSSTCRRNEQNIIDLIKQQNVMIYVARAKDRFGDYGIIGTLILEKKDKTLFVETFLLSCRILGRGIEHHIVSLIGRKALSMKCNKVTFAYVKTERNTPIRTFLESINPYCIFKNSIYYFYAEKLKNTKFFPERMFPPDSFVSNITSHKKWSLDRLEIQKLTTEIYKANFIKEKIRISKQGKRKSLHQLPKTRLERLIIDCMREVLQEDIIGIDDNFLSIGGDSMDVAVLASLLQTKTGKSVDMIHIFEAPTAIMLASVLDNLKDVTISEVEGDIDEVQATPEQIAIWYGSLSVSEPSVYNIPLAFHISGALDISRLQQSYNLLMQQYDSLRAGFTVCKEVLKIKKCDLSQCSLQLDPEPLEKSLEDWLIDRCNESFDFSKGPLVRVYLFSLGENEWGLGFIFHHLICDDRSLAIFMRKLSDLYRDPSKYMNRSGSYFRYALSREKDEKKPNLDFWMNELADCESPVLSNNVSLDRKAGYHKVIITDKLRQNILDFCKQHDLTPFVMLFTAFSIILKTFLRENKFIIAIPVSTRNLAKFDNTIGLFVNLLPVKFSFADNISIIELLTACKKRVSQTIHHSQEPFYSIQQAIGSHIKINAVFAWIRNIGQTPHFEQTSITRLTVNPSHTEYDLRCIVEEEKESLHLNIQYASNIFAKWQITNIGSCFLNVLEKMIKNPNDNVETLSVLYPFQQNLSLKNDSYLNHSLLNIPVKVDYEVSNSQLNEKQKTFIEIFEDKVQNQPNKLAIIYEKITLTYEELNIKANQLVYYIYDKGMRPEKGIAFCIENPVWQIIAVIAILKAGGYYIPLDTKDPPAHRTSIIGDANPLLLLDNLPVDKLSEYPSTNIDYSIKSDQLAYIIYTSGSTGKPKGVMIDHSSLVHRAVEVGRQLKLNSNSRMFCHASPAFDMHVGEWACAFAWGAAVCPLTPSYSFNVGRLWKVMNEYHVTHAWFTPAVLTLLPDKRPLDLKYLIVAGDVTPKPIMERWKKHVTIINAYGPTETTIITHMHAYDGNQSHHVIGRPLPGVITSVLDDKMNPVSVGGIGELYAGGIGVARGYVGQDSFTEERFPTIAINDAESVRMFRTGDLFRVLPNNLIEYVERRDFLVKLNGCRIDLHLIEDKIGSLQGVKEAIVIAIKINEERSTLACYYSGTLNDHKNIRQYLVKQIPQYMVPSKYYHVKELPRLTNGKVNRKKLKQFQPTLQNYKNDNFNSIEKSLSHIWAELLNYLPKNGADDFFYLGGDSLLSVKLLMNIEEEWGIEILMHEFLENSTLSDLARLIESRQITNDKHFIIPIQTQGKQPPLFLIHPSIGIAECYRPLTNYMPDQPIYGIQNPFLLQPDKCYNSLSEMANHYTQEIKKICPNGPYYLGGWSFGGNVALEIGAILEEKGDLVDRVILMDSYAPQIKVLEALLTLDSKVLIEESEYNTSLIKTHRPKLYKGATYLIRAGDSTIADNGWSLLPNLKIRNNISAHHHRMFDFKHLHFIAKELVEVINAD